MQNDPLLKKTLSRGQTIAALSTFMVFLIMMLAYGLSRQVATNTATIHKPIEVPQVVNQGDEDTSMLVTPPTPSSHEQTVQQEYLQTLRDKAQAN